MSRQNQIEEMALALSNLIMFSIPHSRVIAAELYDEGYRKQSEGEWEEQLEEYGETYFFDGFKCSRCEKEFSVPYEKERDDFLQMMKFCPNCGAKMKGGEDNA